MKIKSDKLQEYEDYKKKNSADPYGNRVVTYGEDWANLMEKRLANGEKLESFIDSTSREADYDGITGFMYGCAAKAISCFWEHGEEFRLLYNIHNGGERDGSKANASGGVINPAIITVGR